MNGRLTHFLSSVGALPAKPLFTDEKKRRKRKLCVQDDPKQAVLDAGQKEMGLIRCDKCAMVFSVDSPFDQRAHAKHHEDIANPPALRLTRANLQSLKKSCLSVPFVAEDIEVFRVQQGSVHAARRLERAIELIVNKELNFCPEFGVWGSRHDRIVCFAVKASQTKIMEAAWHDSRDVVEAELLGVNRIWVHASQRGKQVGSRMLDCARSWLYLTKSVLKEEVAFSEPTNDGAAFARKYTNRSDTDFLEYTLKL